MKWKYLQIVDILPQLRPLFNGHFFNVIWKYLQTKDILTQLTPLLNGHFYFLLPMYGRESIVFCSNTRNWDFYGFHVLRSPEIKNHIFRGWSVSVSCDSLWKEISERLNKFSEKVRIWIKSNKYKIYMFMYSVPHIRKMHMSNI